MTIERRARIANHPLIDEARPGEVETWRVEIDGLAYKALISRDDLTLGMRREPDPRWHISVSRFDEPTGPVVPWDVLVAVVHELRPGVPFAIGLPPASQWINTVGGVLHAYEIHDDNLTEQWRFEGRGDRPT